jgi:hypothetical protein
MFDSVSRTVQIKVESRNFPGTDFNSVNASRSVEKSVPGNFPLLIVFSTLRNTVQV